MRPSKQSTIAVAAIVLIYILAMAFEANAEPDWDVGRGWNKNRLKYLTYQCVSVKMPDMQTEYAARMLEQTCFYDVLAGTWDKRSKRDYENNKRRIEIEIRRRR